MYALHLFDRFCQLENECRMGLPKCESIEPNVPNENWPAPAYRQMKMNPTPRLRFPNAERTGAPPASTYDCKLGSDLSSPHGKISRRIVNLYREGRMAGKVGMWMFGSKVKPPDQQLASRIIRTKNKATIRRLHEGCVGRTEDGRHLSALGQLM